MSVSSVWLPHEEEEEDVSRESRAGIRRPRCWPRSSPYSARATISKLMKWEGGFGRPLRPVPAQSASPLGPSLSSLHGVTPPPSPTPHTTTKEWLWRSFSHQMPLAGTLSGSEWGWEVGVKEPVFPTLLSNGRKCDSGNSQTAALCSDSKGNPSQPAAFFRHFLWPQRPRLAHPSPELLKRVCPEGKMHGSRQEGSSEELKRGMGLALATLAQWLEHQPVN